MASAAGAGRARSTYREQRDMEMKVFSKKLWRLMLAKGWSQAELARQTALADPDGAGIGRDMIGGYVRGLHLPDPPHAQKLAAALGISTDELFIPGSEPEVGTPRRVFMNDLGDGTADVNINLRLPVAVAARMVSSAVENAVEAASPPPAQ